jgi:hypothetical protein
MHVKFLFVWLNAHIFSCVFNFKQHVIVQHYQLSSFILIFDNCYYACVSILMERKSRETPRSCIGEGSWLGGAVWGKIKKLRKYN